VALSCQHCPISRSNAAKLDAVAANVATGLNLSRDAAVVTGQKSFLRQFSIMRNAASLCQKDFELLGSSATS